MKTVRSFAAAVALMLVSAIALMLVPATRLSAQTAADRGAFILIQRGDTVAIERFARTTDSLTVDLNVKMQARFVDVAKLATDFTISRLAIQVYLPTAAADAPPAQMRIGDARARALVVVLALVSCS